MTVETLSTRANTLTREEAGVVVVRVAAELDAEGIDTLCETLVSAIAQRDAVVVDLAEARCCDAGLLDAFHMADAQAKSAQATLEFRRVLPPARQALERACLDWRIQLVGEHGA